MKLRLIKFALMFFITPAIAAQGTISFSNIGRGTVTNHGAPSGPSTCVSLSLPNGQLVGEKVNILGAGFFSAGTMVLDGLTGEVTLHVAAWSQETPFLIGYSDPFTVVLGDGIVPPPTLPPSFSGVDIGYVQGPPNPPQKFTKSYRIIKGISQRFFEGPKLRIISVKNGIITIEYEDWITDSRTFPTP